MPAPEVYQFEEFRLDATERRLWAGGRLVAVAPKAFEVLVTLVRRAGTLVLKHELLAMVWPGSFVEEGIVAVHVSALRKALGEAAAAPRCIQTVARSGYRFVAAVRRPEADGGRSRREWSVAVLPGRPNASTGLAFAEALIESLGPRPGLLVRPARAVHAWGPGDGDAAAAGRALRVDAVIDSDLQAGGEELKISARLIRSEDGACLWSGELGTPANGLLDAAEAIAGCVAARLGSGAAGIQAARAGPRPAVQPQAYEWFGRGRFHLLSASMFEIPKAIAAFQAAIELDPGYAAAHAGLALAHCAGAGYRMAPPADAYGAAKSAALRALALDDGSADAQVALGAVLFFSEWDWGGARKSLERAIQLNPNHSEAYLLYGQALDGAGRLEEGLQAKLRALERDPFSPLVHLQISLSYWHQRRYDDAIEWASKTLAIDPRHPHAREHLAGAYLKKGDFERYLAESIRHAEVHGAPAEAIEEFRRVFAEGGRGGQVRMVLDRAAARPEAFPAMQLALFYGEAGDLGAAFHHLERAIDSHDPGLVHLAVGPQWDGLRGDHRFAACLARMGL